MKRVTGIGGIFFRSTDPARLNAWYREHLGIETREEGTVFHWRDAEDPTRKGYTVWSPFPADTGYFQPSTRQFMMNYRVENLVALLEQLKREGVEIVGQVEEYPYGKFGWIMDPEGTKIELWEPIDEKLNAP